MIGSSTAAGYGLPDAGGTINTGWNMTNDDPVNSWPNRLRRYLKGVGVLDTLVNLAVMGEDIYQAMPQDRLDYPHVVGRPWPNPSANIVKALDFNPDIVIVNFPSNEYNLYTVTEVMARYRDIYAVATENGHTQAYITTTQPRSNDPEFSDPVQRAKLKELRDSIMMEFGSHAIDFYTSVVDNNPELSPGVPNPNYLGALPQYGQGDDIHLNEDGHAFLYQAVLSANLIPIGNLPLKIGKISVKRIDDTHITVSFNVLDGNTEKQFFIWVKDKAGNTKSVKVIIPEASKTSQTITETIQIY
ncbi:MAG TPA: SGNH/GDSL hydrolase family protein [Puia sp.]|uniref:SGNH/GDSL hydrolase family protein n=1 Tax=Puia sp. TaxID=2045100 RepID=UPI002BDA6E14|nr:SGNH/GDSL hydrolase family protein [Puia sp.]HVU99098.1 SGNH/GDSL hydrolase family protein [Puia sp.]